MVVYTVVDDLQTPEFPLGVELEVCIRREDAERFIAEVRRAVVRQPYPSKRK